MKQDYIEYLVLVIDIRKVSCAFWFIKKTVFYMVNFTCCWKRDIWFQLAC